MIINGSDLLNTSAALERTKILKEAERSGALVSASGTSFKDILTQTVKDQSTDALRFSKHANERLSQRNIALSSDQLNRLSGGAEKARAKGINESLIVVDNLACIVNVKNNTVITAVGDDDNKTFTNIDGAVFN